MKNEIQKAISEALAKLYPSHKDVAFSIEYAPNNIDADFASNVAMVLAKKVGKNPMEVAQGISDELQTLDFELLVVPPGFINFIAPESNWHDELKKILELGDKYGLSDKNKGTSVNIESVSANPTGPLTVGHGRGAIIGQVLANVLDSQGFEVSKDYYYNDAGLQLKKLGESVMLRTKQVLGDDVIFPEDLYQGDYIMDIAKEYVKENNLSQAHDNLKEYSKFAIDRIFKQILTTLESLGVTFDNFANESDQKTAEVLEKLKKAGVTYEKDGATWLKLENSDEDRVLVRSSGEPTYRLPDIAYHLAKVEKFDQVITILGADHIAQFPDISFAVDKLGGDSERIKVIINQFVTLKGGKKMSTRLASYVTLDELVDEVTADVVKFFFTSTSASSHMSFDLALAKDSSDKNPLYKVQYAHARICSVLKKAGIDKAQLSATSPEKLNKETYTELIKELSKYPYLLESISETFAVHQLPHYLINLADKFNSFYENNKIISDDKEVTEFLLAVVSGVKAVIANGLGVLGINAPEEM